MFTYLTLASIQFFYINIININRKIIIMIAFGCLLGRGLARQLVAKPSEFIEETKVNIWITTLAHTALFSNSHCEKIFWRDDDMSEHLQLGVHKNHDMRIFAIFLLCLTSLRRTTFFSGLWFKISFASAQVYPSREIWSHIRDWILGRIFQIRYNRFAHQILTF